MAIFGNLAPKFISEYDETVLLDYATLESNWIIPDEIEHKSVITGTKNFITLGDYASFTVSINLFKYGDVATRVSKFREIYAYLHKDVVFYPYRDGYPIQNKNGVNVPFHITDMKIGSVMNINEYDYLVLQFESTGYIDISKSLI